MAGWRKRLLPLLLDSDESVFGNWRDVIWFEEDDTYRNGRALRLLRCRSVCCV